MDGLVWRFEQCAAVIITFVVRLAIAVENSLREQPRPVFAVLPNQKMVVVWHQAIDNDGQGKLAEVFLHLPQNKQVVVFFAEDGCAMRAAVIDVVVMAGKERGSSGFKVSLSVLSASHL